jgi:hypothetical protein
MEKGKRKVKKDFLEEIRLINYKNILRDDDLQALKGLLDQKVGNVILICRAEMDFSNMRVESKGVILKQSNGKFLKIVSDWVGDTENEGLACHELSTQSLDSIEGLIVKTVKRDDKTLRGLQYNASVRFAGYREEVKKINIYSLQESEGKDSVQFDKGIELVTNKGNSILIRSVWGIQGGLYISDNLDALIELKTECLLRTSLD